MTTTADTAAVKKLVAAELRRRRRRKYLRLFAIGVATNIATALLNGWYVMLAVGVAHAEWIPALPTIGYWWTVLLLMLLRGTFGTARPSRKATS